MSVFVIVWSTYTVSLRAIGRCFSVGRQTDADHLKRKDYEACDKTVSMGII
ncbi:MAG: hypothetical protein P4N59_23405 [Negativicutes bacterium]|nr:hypothetical protein [Negativicutes bacterium]